MQERSLDNSHQSRQSWLEADQESPLSSIERTIHAAFDSVFCPGLRESASEPGIALVCPNGAPRDNLIAANLSSFPPTDGLFEQDSQAERNSYIMLDSHMLEPRPLPFPPTGDCHLAASYRETSDPYDSFPSLMCAGPAADYYPAQARAEHVTGISVATMFGEVNTASIIAKPREYDVLYGRGKIQRWHPGNRRMKLIIDLHRDAYKKAKKQEKANMTREIVKLIKCSGVNDVRFLRFEESANCWLEVSDEEARMKISHAMRDGKSTPFKIIDPKVLEATPLLPDHMNRDLLDKVGASRYREQSARPKTVAQEKTGADSSLIEPFALSSMAGQSSSKHEAEDRKPAAKDDDGQRTFSDQS